MERKRLTRNAARCKRCKVTVESYNRHDFVRCACGSIAVDGGLDYVRRMGRPEDIEELCEWEATSNYRAEREKGNYE